MPQEVNLEERIIFFTPIYEAEINIDNEKIKKEIYQIKEWDSGRVISNRGGWQSHTLLEEDVLDFSELTNLAKLMYSSASEIFMLWGIRSTPPSLGGFWININNKKDFNLPHTHPVQLIVSAVYYINTNEQSGRIVFSRPDIQDAYFKAENMNEYTFEAMYFSPRNNGAFFFPSYLNHYVEPNLSDEERISIAFNFE